HKAERGIAAEVEVELHRQRRGDQAARIDPGEKAPGTGAAAAASAARLKPQGRAGGVDSGVRAEPARIAEAEAQLRAAEVERNGIDAGPRQVRRKGEARLAGYMRVIHDRLVDR